MRFGYLNGEYTFFDYGCGKQDDLNGLKENNISVSGWDPYYLPNENKNKADLVNLGFVINVIEEVEERIIALKNAYELTNKLLVIG